MQVLSFVLGYLEGKFSRVVETSGMNDSCHVLYLQLNTEMMWPCRMFNLSSSSVTRRA